MSLTPALVIHKVKTQSLRCDLANFSFVSSTISALYEQYTWQVLRSVLHSIPEKVLPSHDSLVSLANHFVTFLSDKISKIRDSFSLTLSLYLLPLIYLNLTSLNPFDQCL